MIVVGCGVAGLSAAVAAAQAGARVVVLERAPREERGGQSRYTEAYLRMKSHTEVTDDFETHIAENGCGAISPDLIDEASLPPASRSALVNTLSIADPDVVETLANQAGPTIAWLEQMGVRFDFLPTQFLTRSQPRLLPVGGGAALVEALAARAEGLKVDFLYDTAAQDLVRGSDGVVTGVRVKPRGGAARTLHGKVVLACGGFEGNAEMMTRYVGPRSVHLRPICRGAYYNRGDGIRMGLAVGAAPSGDFGSYHAEPVDPRSGIAEPAVFIFPYGVLVNQHGQRFTGEPAYFKHVETAGQVMLDELGRTAEDFSYAVFHQPNPKFPLKAGATLGFKPEQIKPGMLVAVIAEKNVVSTCGLTLDLVYSLAKKSRSNSAPQASSLVGRLMISSVGLGSVGSMARSASSFW